MDLYQAFNPFVEFWYYHDTNVATDDLSYMEVIANTNGTENKLQTVYLRDPQGHHGWKKHTVSLSQFTTVRGCLLVQFRAVSRAMTTASAQYIDYIYMSSEADVAVSEIIVPDVTACERTGKDIFAVVTTTRNQSVTFENTSLILEVNGQQVNTENLHGKTLGGSSSDTIRMYSMDFPKGITSIKAYLSNPVDGVPANDTAKLNININPQMEVVIHKLSGTTPNTAGLEVPQSITIKNTGGITLSNIELILVVNAPAAPYYFTAKETFTQSIAPGATADFTFSEAYTVPWAAQYDVNVYAYLGCDSLLSNTNASIYELVNMTDLHIVKVTNPADSTIDHAGDAITVSLRIKNRNIGKSYNEGDAKAGILIKDVNGNLISSVDLEELPAIEGEAEITYTFNNSYTVPAETNYLLTVYISSTDEEYFDNDTVNMPRKTDYVGMLDRTGVSFTMEQNIPNPARESTLINYSVPQDGEVVFHVYSISGQLLYTEKENVPFGDHQIELNLSDYAAGIYFYSMEYKGQRLVKRMSVKR
jgi:hypothetical protein